MSDKQIIGKLPEFTEDTANAEIPIITAEPEVKETTEDKTEVVEEKEAPAVTPTEIKPDILNVVDTRVEKQVDALQREKVELLKQIQELRGQRRELKEKEILKVDQQLDELKDLHPDDVKLVEKILRNRGYMTKDEANQMFYEAVKKEETTKFLEEFPEYKPENDPSDLNWHRLEQEMAWYRRPDDPHQLNVLLRRAHRAIAVPSSDRGTKEQVKTRQVQVASVGSGGVQRSSSVKKSLDLDRRAMLIRGGWSEEEINQIEKRLPE